MSLNKVMLIGNVGVEPEVRYVDQGVAVASLRLATSRRGYTLQNGTQVPEQTDWHNVVLWRRLAETVEKYVHKGDKLYVEGSLHTRSYDDKSGVKRYRTEVWADTIELLSPPKQQAAASSSASPSTTSHTTDSPTIVSAGQFLYRLNPNSPTEEGKEGLPF